MNNLENNLNTELNNIIDKMQKRFDLISAGRANPKMLDNVKIDYYGTLTPISQISAISSPDAMQLLIKPFNQQDIKNIAAAINKSNLNLNPQNEGNQLRIQIPALTEEIRNTKVKEVKKINEDTKIQIRNIRRDFNNKIKADADLTKDEIREQQNIVQKIIDSKTLETTALTNTKETLLMKI